ncbi:uncharacterized protein LOC125504146 [Dendroctonus ponderosae]|uniref:uncharacterized protein LOC125504146 n=1 Tax=Dendroctonus ponderosae TaxID=77166 RepID=UPI002034EC03|nr:uncharacterized protein LOC125504146 [Dendroctonus ponderosae]
MKPRFYVHMGPKTADKVSCMWKAAHISIFLLILGSSGVAAACMYNILDMYNFNCILYARVSLEYTFEERFKAVDEDNGTETTSDRPETTAQLQARALADDVPPNSSSSKDSSGSKDTPLDPKPAVGSLQSVKALLRRLGSAHSRRNQPLKASFGVNNTGFLNMRKTAFATLYMCDLVLFAPLASFIIAIFLGALIGVGGKGGAGNPGDVLPNPWICVYPFLGLCAFMMIFCFIADNIYHKGLAAFCSRYFDLTKSKGCSRRMDHYNVQFSADQKGPPRAFYLNYLIGSYGVQLTSALWALQSLIYVFRIICLADFSLYLTRIRLKDDDKGPDPKMASVVLRMIDSKNKMM